MGGRRLARKFESWRVEIILDLVFCEIIYNAEDVVGSTRVWDNFEECKKEHEFDAFIR